MAPLRHAEWANAEQLPEVLGQRGVRYVFLGRELGGRPDNAACYDRAGYVLYGRVARLGSFTEGVGRLYDGLGALSRGGDVQ